MTPQANIKGRAATVEEAMDIIHETAESYDDRPHEVTQIIIEKLIGGGFQYSAVLSDKTKENT